jgi:hypothetical protein
LLLWATCFVVGDVILFMMVAGVGEVGARQSVRSLIAYMVLDDCLAKSSRYTSTPSVSSEESHSISSEKLSSLTAVLRDQAAYPHQSVLSHGFHR